MKFKYSLISIYAFFAIVIIMAALVMSGWVIYSDYQTYKKNEYAYVKQEAIKLIYQLDERMGIAERMIDFLAKKIVDSYDYTYANIAFLIKERNACNKGNKPWSLISFINTKQYAVVDSVNGVRPIPHEMVTEKKREWIGDAKNDPGGLHFGTPSKGVISGENIVPAGYGIVDMEHYFVGYLATGVLIDDLVNNLKKNIKDNIEFIIIDDNKHVIAASSDILLKCGVMVPEYIYENFFDNICNSIQVFKSPLEFADILFTHYVISKKYPFSLIIGNKDLFSYSGLREKLAPHVIRHVVLALIFATILLWLGYKLFKPLIQMAEIVKLVVRGGKRVEIPEYEIQELNLLGDQLKNIQIINKDIRKKNKEIIQINDKLAKVNEFIKSNVSFLSHELRNPASNIIGFSQIIKDKFYNNFNKEGKEYIDIINQSATHQNQQIDFFLKLFKYREEGKELENNIVDLKHVINFSCNMLRYYSIQHDVKFKIDIAKDLPNIFGDEIILGHLVQNFISNGIKYNKKGGDLIIKAFVRAISSNKKELVLQFKDNGIGINKNDIDLMFQKFNRIKNKNTTGIVGYGLGLTYAKNCIIAHDGMIQISSSEGEGATFTVIFPFYRIAKK